jgi:hypothetical protein
MGMSEIKDSIKAWVDENPRKVAIIVGAVVMFTLGALWF